LGTNTIATSPDGITWTGRAGSSIFGTTGIHVAWNGNLWVATGIGTNSFATSPDGITWTGRGAGPFTSAGYGVAWNGSYWVATGNGTSHTIATSTDGISWTGQGKTAFTTAGYDVAWNGSLWVAVGTGTNTIASSTDGTTWTPRTNTLSQGNGVAWNGSNWIAVGNGSDYFATSSNGINWIGRGTSPFTTFGYNVASRRILPYVGSLQVLPTDISASFIRGGSGTVSAPKYTFSIDPSSGVYMPSSNNVGFTTAGVERARIDLSGLQISSGNIRNQAGTVSAPSYTFVNDLSMGLYDPATNVLGFTTAGVERMRINASGNVGISTTAPRGALDVSGIAYARLPVTVISGTTIDLSTNFDLSANSYFYITNSAFSNITTPATAAITTARGGTFWQFKNSTSSFLSVTLTNTLTLTSPVSIAPSNAITLVVSPSVANTLLLF
jgi:hypothetical protein